MRAMHATYVAIFLLSGASAHSLAERDGRSPRLFRELRTPPTAKRVQDRFGGSAHLRQAPAVIEQSRSAMDLASATALARQVLGVRLELAPDPRTDREPSWFELPAPPTRKPFRPRLMLHPMGFPTGGGGVKLQLRY